MKKSLLFISPVMPNPQGLGPHKRAHYFLQALSRSYDIHLLVLPRHLKRPDCHQKKAAPYKSIDLIGAWRLSNLPAIFRFLLLRLGIPSHWLYRKFPMDLRFVTSGRIRKVKKKLAGRTFDAVHIFRLHMVPFALWMKDEYPEVKLYLDLDDLESIVHDRFAELYGNRGRPGLAALYQKEAVKYRALEHRWLPHFDNIYVCSELDRNKVREIYRLDNVFAVPNVVDIRPPGGRPSLDGKPFVFLFVGTFGYFPNHDGVSFFVEKILPVLREKMRKPFQLLLVGPGLPRNIRHSLKKIPEIRYLGWVPHIEEAYRQSDAAIVPIRAGGGARIKALEAFSFSMPVIATRIGLEGLGVLHGQHAMIADSPDEFAAYCCEVARDAGLRGRLIENAYQLVKEQYAPPICAQCLSGALAKHEQNKSAALRRGES